MSTSIEDGDRRASQMEAASGAAKNQRRAAPGKASPCDFSAFKPVGISDWLPKGVIKQVVPVYPSEAKRRGVHGRVSVRVLINSQGAVERACGIGHSLLTHAAEDAALGWRFQTPVFNWSQKFPYIQDFLLFEFVLEEPRSKTSR
jgi:TonB family protein